MERKHGFGKQGEGVVTHVVHFSLRKEDDKLVSIRKYQAVESNRQTRQTPHSGYIKIILRDVQTEAHVGLCAWELHPEQPSRLVVNVEMYAKQDTPLDAETRESIIDYARVRTVLRAWPSRPHTPLLETLVEELIQACFEIERVDACYVSVVKPTIFNDAAAAGVEAYRERRTWR